MRIPSATGIVAPLGVALWLAVSGPAGAVFNGIPPATSVKPDDVQGVTVKLPDQPPQQAVDRATCERTKKPGEICPEGYDWYVNVPRPVDRGSVVDVTFTGLDRKTVADGQFAINPYGHFGNWLMMDVRYGTGGAGLATDGFSLPQYHSRLTDAFTRSGFADGVGDDSSIYFQEFNAWWDFSLGQQTGLPPTTGKPLIKTRQRCSHVPGGTSLTDALRLTGIVPVTGYTIPADDGGGYVIGGYPKLDYGQGYKFITESMLVVDEPRTGTGGGQPGVGQPDGGQPDDGPIKYDFGWEKAGWTEYINCRKELQNGKGGPQVNVRPKAPDAKDFVGGKTPPQWNPATDGKGPAVATPDDPEAIKALADQMMTETGGQPVEIEMTDGDCTRTRIPVEAQIAHGDGVAAITASTPANGCPWPSGRISMHMVDEEVYSVITFGTTETYKDLADIVAKLQAKVAPHYDPTARCGKCIEQLDIWGHGDTGGGYISFGPNDAVIGNQNMGAVDQGLAALGGLMCVGGKVVVNQCKAGTGNKGTQALQQMADKIGVPVQGADGKLKACRIFGGAVTSYTTANPGPNAKTPEKNTPGDVTAPSTTGK